MDMNQTYEWKFNEPGEALAVHMDNFERRGKVFDATLTMERREMTGPALAKVLITYPLMTVQVIAGIYWQALKLRLKGAGFHPHPKSGESDKREVEQA